ncbi:MAG: hypothetical protein M3N52_02675 [Actinomycetota bacterium]|nr:hypothetical protein [Actinomycetota bacterium]
MQDLWGVSREEERRRAIWMMRFVFAVVGTGLVVVALSSGALPMPGGGGLPAIPMGRAVSAPRDAAAAQPASVHASSPAATSASVNSPAGPAVLLPQVDGYRYTPGPPELELALDAVAGPLRAAGHDFQYFVVEDAGGAFVAMAFAARTEAGEALATPEELRAQVARFSGAQVEELALSGTPAVTSRRSDGVRIVSWVTSDGVVLLGGHDGAALESLATKIIGAR